MKHKRKRGRPIIHRVDPTPEMEAKRYALVGEADPILASYPLGVWWAQKFITENEHDAGIYYAYLFGRVIGSVGPSAGGGGKYEALEDMAQEILEPLWREAANVLFSVGRSAKNAVDNVAVYEPMESAWRIAEGRTHPSDFHAKKGLTALAQWRRVGRLRVV